MNTPQVKEFKVSSLGNSLMVQWLEFCAFTAEGTGSISGWGAKIHRPHGLAKIK